MITVGFIWVVHLVEMMWWLRVPRQRVDVAVVRGPGSLVICKCELMWCYIFAKDFQRKSTFPICFRQKVRNWSDLRLKLQRLHLYYQQQHRSHTVGRTIKTYWSKGGREKTAQHHFASNASTESLNLFLSEACRAHQLSSQKQPIPACLTSYHGIKQQGRRADTHQGSVLITWWRRKRRRRGNGG